jgi:hypothetical protein
MKDSNAHPPGREPRRSTSQSSGTFARERPVKRCIVVRAPRRCGAKTQMVHDRAEALGALVRPAAFKAVESWCKLTLVGSIPMRFRSTIGPPRGPLVSQDETRRPGTLPDAQSAEEA